MTTNKDTLFIQNMLLSSLRIHSVILSSGYEEIELLDHGLRKNIWGREGYTDFTEHYLPSLQEHTIYVMKDGFSSYYALVRLPLDSSILSIGPYLLEEIDENFFTKVVSQNRLSQNMMPSLQNYYTSVPFVDSTLIISTLNTVATFLFESASNYKISFVDQVFQTNEPTFDFIPEPEMSLAMEVLESKYDKENRLIAAISKGDRREAIKAFHDFSRVWVTLRGTEPLQSQKNQAIVLNTLCRKAAETSFVHPIYLEELCSSFEKRINEASKLASFEELYLEMVRKYCVMVANHSLKQYSSLIRKALHSIHFHLSLPLSLSTVAKELAVHPNYLSTLFTKELHITFTEYVHQERMKAAIKLLNTTDMQIQNIAWYVGFSDVNYFTKRFKTFTGLTPSVYRKNVQQKKTLS
jgi:YesN/AraC family two-component response regulator